MKSKFTHTVSLESKIVSKNFAISIDQKSKISKKIVTSTPVKQIKPSRMKYVKRAGKVNDSRKVENPKSLSIDVITQSTKDNSTIYSQYGKASSSQLISQIVSI